MAGEIAVTPEGLRSIASRMNSGAKEVEAILSTLASHVAPIRSEWTGPAQAYFNAFWDQSLQDAKDLRSVLVGMATLTESAATAYETTDRNVAASFDEFRTSPDGARTWMEDVDDYLLTNSPEVVDTTDSQPALSLLPAVPENEVVAVEGELPENLDVSSEASADTDVTNEAELAVVNEVTVEEGPADGTYESLSASKANGRLPWTRFITKSARPEGGTPSFAAGYRNVGSRRRTRPSSRDRGSAGCASPSFHWSPTSLRGQRLTTTSAVPTVGTLFRFATATWWTSRRISKSDRLVRSLDIVCAVPSGSSPKRSGPGVASPSGPQGDH